MHTMRNGCTTFLLGVHARLYSPAHAFLKCKSLDTCLWSNILMVVTSSGMDRTHAHPDPGPVPTKAEHGTIQKVETLACFHKINVPILFQRTRH